MRCNVVRCKAVTNVCAVESACRQDWLLSADPRCCCATLLCRAALGRTDSASAPTRSCDEYYHYSAADIHLSLPYRRHTAAALGYNRIRHVDVTAGSHVCHVSPRACARSAFTARIRASFAASPSRPPALALACGLPLLPPLPPRLPVPFPAASSSALARASAALTVRVTMSSLTGRPRWLWPWPRLPPPRLPAALLPLRVMGDIGGCEPLAACEGSVPVRPGPGDCERGRVRNDPSAVRGGLQGSGPGGPTNEGLGGATSVGDEGSPYSVCTCANLYGRSLPRGHLFRSTGSSRQVGDEYRSASPSAVPPAAALSEAPIVLSDRTVARSVPAGAGSGRSRRDTLRVNCSCSKWSNPAMRSVVCGVGRWRGAPGGGVEGGARLRPPPPLRLLRLPAFFAPRGSGCVRACCGLPPPLSPPLPVPPPLSALLRSGLPPPLPASPPLPPVPSGGSAPDRPSSPPVCCRAGAVDSMVS